MLLRRPSQADRSRSRRAVLLSAGTQAPFAGGSPSANIVRHWPQFDQAPCALAPGTGVGRTRLASETRPVLQRYPLSLVSACVLLGASAWRAIRFVIVLLFRSSQYTYVMCHVPPMYSLDMNTMGVSVHGNAVTPLTLARMRRTTLQKAAKRSRRRNPRATGTGSRGGPARRRWPSLRMVERAGRAVRGLHGPHTASWRQARRSEPPMKRRPGHPTPRPEVVVRPFPQCHPAGSLTVSRGPAELPGRATRPTAPLRPLVVSPSISRLPAWPGVSTPSCEARRGAGFGPSGCASGTLAGRPWERWIRSPVQTASATVT